VTFAAIANGSPAITPQHFTDAPKNAPQQFCVPTILRLDNFRKRSLFATSSSNITVSQHRSYSRFPRRSKRIGWY